MGIYTTKSKFQSHLTRVVYGLVAHHVSADAITLSAIVVSLIAALVLAFSPLNPALLLSVPVLLLGRLLLNVLDGMVALAAGKASRSGEIVNELPDRISDVVIFVSVGHSGLCHPLGGYWVAIFALLVAYVGTLGQAVGVQREFSGVMSKPWRMVLLHVGAWVTLGCLWWGDGRIRYGGLTVLDWTHLGIIAGCVQTIWIRLARIMAALQAQAATPHTTEPQPER